MTKYEPLKVFLGGSTTSELPMTFSEIEAVIGAALPPVAFRHRAWWSNNPSNNVMTRAWLDAGYQTGRVDMAGRRLVFRRAGGQAALDTGLASPSRAGPSRGTVAALRLALSGTVRVAAGADLTAPTGEAWTAEEP